MTEKFSPKRKKKKERKRRNYKEKDDPPQSQKHTQKQPTYTLQKNPLILHRTTTSHTIITHKGNHIIGKKTTKYCPVGLGAL